MQALTKTLKQKLALTLFAALAVTSNSVLAEAKDMPEQHDKHQQHAQSNDDSKHFHGVYYGFFPCNKEDCDGMKMTLSLKNKSNYLLVSQPAKASAREYFDKGKYTWDTEQQIVTLKSKKKKSLVRQFHIKDDDTLIQLDENGNEMWPDEKTKTTYILRRHNDAPTKKRKSHFH